MVRDDSELAKPRFFKNIQSMVHVGDYEGDDPSIALFAFPNPPTFMGRDELTLRDAEYETEALLDHLLNHRSTAPFVATTMIQRFVTSNPPPRYVETVSKAFKLGQYTHEGVSFGAGNRGDLAATIAAVLLDREATSTVVVRDPTFGKVREPIIKMMHFVRALDNTPMPGFELTAFSNAVSQHPFAAPSVFSYFQDDYKPNGAVGIAGLLSPEASVFTGPNIVDFVNALQSTVQYGFSVYQWDGYATGLMLLAKAIPIRTQRRESHVRAVQRDVSD